MKKFAQPKRGLMKARHCRSVSETSIASSMKTHFSHGPTPLFNSEWRAQAAEQADQDKINGGGDPQ